MNTGVLAATPAHRPPDGRAVSVVVVAPQPLVRRGLRNLLSPHRGFRVVAECSTVDDGARLAGRGRPDVVLVDLVPHLTGRVTATAVAAVTRAGARLVVLGDLGSTRELSAMATWGVAAVLDRDVDPVRIADVVRRSAGLREGECDQPEDAAWSRLRIAPTFTPREAQVLALLVRGDRNEHIAEALGVCASTVKFHVRGLLRKFGVENRTQIAYIAAKNDLA